MIITKMILLYKKVRLINYLQVWTKFIVQIKELMSWNVEAIVMAEELEFTL